MITPAIPLNEKQRLETLNSHNVLDTAAEERFDRLTRMAKRMFDVPFALVSLVDENRQWFKSCIGLDATETSRDISFCGHAILGDEVFVIPDALEDTRFIDNPLVTDAPHIRFYAGCPLKALNGHKLGTLCVIDQKPRKFSNEDIEVLIDLANMVERELAAVQLATLDELTGISNRRGFTMLAKHSLNLSVRKQVPTSLVYIDLDDFKYINDNFGHAEGDNVLKIFAKQMENTFRSTDVFARLGGDEFVMLLTEADKTMASELMARFEESFQEHNKLPGQAYKISFSYGVVEYDPQKHTDIDNLLHDCDSLMYQYKKASKNTG